MRITTIKCDVCGRDVSSLQRNSLNIPVISHKRGETVLRLHDFDDICDECYNELGRKISEMYYDMCKAHGHSGIISIPTDD